MPDISDIGANIRYMRKRRKLTIKQLADRIFVSHQTVSKWERGEAFPSVDKIHLIAKALNTSEGFILWDDRREAYTMTIDYTEEYIDMIDELMKMSDDDALSAARESRSILFKNHNRMLYDLHLTQMEMQQYLIGVEKGKYRSPLEYWKETDIMSYKLSIDPRYILDRWKLENRS